jgi:hypothetical protein
VASTPRGAQAIVWRVPILASSGPLIEGAVIAAAIVLLSVLLRNP